VPFARRAGSASDIGGVTAAGLIKGFGDRVNVVAAQVYQAPADGLIVASVGSGNSGGAAVDVLIDSSAPPSTSRGYARFLGGESELITIPVKSGEFYKVLIGGSLPTGLIYYMPIEKWQ